MTKVLDSNDNVSDINKDSFIEDADLKDAEDFSGLTCRFRVKWTLSKEEFNRAKCISLSNCEDNMKTSNGDSQQCSHLSNALLLPYAGCDQGIETLKSKFFTLDFLGNLKFQLCLGFVNDRYFLTTKRNPSVYNDFLEMQYAFVTLKHMVYQLTYPKGSRTLQHIQSRCLTEEVLQNAAARHSLDVHVMVMLHADIFTIAFGSDVMKSSNLNLWNFASWSLESCDISIKKKMIPMDRLAFKNEMWLFGNGGQLPALDVEKAKFMVLNSKVLNLSGIRALGMEYLVHKLNKHLVLDLLTFAISNKIEHLQRACLEFLFNKCKIVKTEKLE